MEGSAADEDGHPWQAFWAGALTLLTVGIENEELYSKECCARVPKLQNDGPYIILNAYVLQTTATYIF